ncbi:MAG: TrkH family potassium uptake protein [Candidatus ainarchaeum sp.]|nr:TrkH family potassium uptake protein [Candidatus ainarchaeum sp.]MDD3975915.1 TrkH family potassium uptake protein [Candidatus ainarchaeum sp.]
MGFYWNFRNIFHTTGKTIMFSSFTLLLPIILSLFLKEGFFVTNTYILIFLLTFIFGYLFFKFIKRENIFGLTFSQSLLIVFFIWLLYAIFSSLPFYFLSELNFIDSFFESMSSLTTTGLSMYSTGVPILKSLIIWRSFLSWIGGLGIIVLAYLGISKNISFSSRLFSAEGHERLRPSPSKTIINMWIIYLILTILGVLFLYFAGMTLFDSFNYSMSAISTNGVQSNSLGLSIIGTPLIKLVLIIIMIFGATSFILHYNFYKKKSFKIYFKDKQFISMILLILISLFFVFLKLGKEYDLITILLNIISMITCGGFTTFSTNQLLNSVPFVFGIFLLLMFIGGSTNSTTGGIKINRFIIFLKSIFWKIKQSTLPNIAYFPRKYNNNIIENKEIRSIYFFILVYLFFIVIGIFVFTFNGYSINSSTFEIISAQSNVGLSIGLTNSFMPLSTKLMLIINMWIGRLEIIPVLSILGLIFIKKHKH